MTSGVGLTSIELCNLGKETNFSNTSVCCFLMVESIIMFNCTKLSSSWIMKAKENYQEYSLESFLTQIICNFILLYKKSYKILPFII